MRRTPIDDESDIIEELDHIKPIVLMLQQRLCRGDEFRLEISGFVVEWTLAALKDVVKGGVKLIRGLRAGRLFFF